MQWRRQRRVTHVIGSSNHVLLLARYQDAPPGEEDEEEGLRNGYVKDQENDTSMHSFDRNGQGGYKPRRIGNSGGSSYAGAVNRSHKDESTSSPSQPKIIFNEDEYARITTPRQDVLFKKGYLSRKKPWAGNASTSATPSTTESQSASHSTADGSETTEDQQLLDRDCGTGEYPPMMNSAAQLGYGTFYDHASGYYYEYPVMLVGPAPVPAQVGPSVLAAVPYEPVPLRPIEWVNPAFVPKLAADQQYCMMDYQTNQSTESVPVVEEQENTILIEENTNGTCNENDTGSASCSGSVAGEMEEQPAETNTAKENQTEDQQTEEQAEEQYIDEQYVEQQHLENGINGGPYLEPVLMQQPVHVSHVIPVPQPYMYPGHYMFGPPLVNVNGVTIQAGPMIRTTDVAAMSAACIKRRKKKKRRKQIRVAVGNTEDEEEGEYSSECDTTIPSSRLSWTASSTSTATTTTTSNRPLNPECQEFQLQSVEPNTSLSSIPTSANTPTFTEDSSVNQLSTLSSDATSVDKNKEPCNGVVSDDPQSQVEELVTNSNSDEVIESSEKSSTPNHEVTDPTNKTKKPVNCLNREQTLLPNNIAKVTEIETLPNNETNKTTSNSLSIKESSKDKVNGIGEETLVNGKMMDTDLGNMQASITAVSSRPSSRCSDDKTSKTNSMENVEAHEENHESLSNNKISSGVPKRKYSAKGTKFVREPTPGPDLNNATEVETDKSVVHDLTQNLNSVNLSNDSFLKPEINCCSKIEDQTSENCASKDVCNHQKDDPIEISNEDSGFESQTRLSDYPITEAVTEWLRRANSPNIFITPLVSGNSDETEDEDEVDEEPPKNLQGNPILALSAKSSADDAMTLLRTASCGEFARVSNVKSQDQPETNSTGGSRRKRDMKKKLAERRRVRHVDGKLENEVVSSSDSCGQQELPVNVMRKKNPSKQQDVGDVCEFTEKDSVAGMRVATSSRMDSKRVNARRMKRQGRSNRDPTNNSDTKIRRAENDENDEGVVGDTMNVRTFEKGEIVVSEDGKLLTTSTYEPILRNSHDASTVIETVCENETVKETITKTEESNRRSSGEEENCSKEVSLDSIEEPDVLECWEAEMIEPVITPKKMQCRGTSCDGEAAEEDNNETEQVNLDYVQKYYRLARESVTSSIEEEVSGSKMHVDSIASITVPNNSEQSEEIRTQKKDKNDIPVDEAFEVYESCYTGKTPFLGMDSKIFKSRTLYGQEGEHPIPCKAVCCNLQ
ncbi:uncharacterized protein LOC143177692 isoform X2 [Calliopsis andreniformis]|uniref:uncharacterized protein LOC143177692 isoform X2 n=1 Tax=Calliopsis andreniformis TaxID=337506 RepID=UPI003FCC81EC